MTQALAIDIGSSSVRAACYDVQGRELDGAACGVPYQLDVRADGSATVDARVLAAHVATALDGALAGGAVPDVVGVSCFWHSLVGVDDAGAPATEVLTWADTRANASAHALAAMVDAAAAHARTGAPVHASFWPAKLHYLANGRADAFVRVARWMSFAEYLYLQLFGVPACSTSMASATGMYDSAEGRWDVALAEAAGVDVARLPAVADEAVSGLQKEWAPRWPALAHIPWMPAVGDGACANVGSGCASRDRIGLTIGTSSAMRVVHSGDDAPLAPALWRYRIDGRRAITGGALNEGGGLVVWLGSLLGLDASSPAFSEVASLEPDAHGLTLLPFAAGERSPGWAAGARMTISGLSFETRPVDILRATLESVAYRLKLIADPLSRIAAQGAECIGSGGALRAIPAWAPIVADVLGRPVRVSDEREAACRGAALLAFERLGAITDAASVEARTGAAIEPDAGRHARYAEAIARQQALYRSIVEKS